MPLCEGRSTGPGNTVPCPDTRNDETVRLRQGDLLLCKACTDARFPPAATAPAAGQKVLAEDSSRQRKPATKSRSSNIQSGVKKSQATSADTDSQHASAEPVIVVSELLMYVNFHRNRSAAHSLRNLILAHFSVSEVGEAKRRLIELFGAEMSADCDLLTNRRDSQQRAAKEVEVDDIIGVLDAADNLNILGRVAFAAIAFDRLPRYGPEELNVCAVVDKQVHTEATVRDLSAKVDALAAAAVGHNMSADSVLVDMIVRSVDQKIQDSSKTIDCQLQQLVSVCDALASAVSARQTPQTPPAVPTSSTGPPGRPAAPLRPRPSAELDRTRNIVVTGVAEDPDGKVWRDAVVDVLQTAAGREVQIADAFRLGGRYDAKKTRPILVRLHSVWDKRIVLSGARNLSNQDRFRRIFVAADEPLDVRRRNTLDRMKVKAQQKGKAVDINNGTLSIDGVAVYSLVRGFIRTTSAAAAETEVTGSPELNG